MIIKIKDDEIELEDFLDLITLHPSKRRLSEAMGWSEYYIQKAIKTHFPDKRRGAISNILELYGKARCCVCKKAQPLSDFGIDATRVNNRNYRCNHCNQAKVNKWLEVDENRERYRQYSKQYHKDNPEYFKQYNKKYYEENKEEIIKRNERWRATDAGKASTRASSAKRRAAILKRTPLWADLEAIKKFYHNCPEGYEVDHIIPLQGERVSGLHVLENLQYLTIKENRSKSNNYEV